MFLNQPLLRATVVVVGRARCTRVFDRAAPTPLLARRLPRERCFCCCECDACCRFVNDAGASALANCGASSASAPAADHGAPASVTAEASQVAS